MYDYDVVVIGAGSAGLTACKLANGLGRKTALIEKRRISGDCVCYRPCSQSIEEDCYNKSG